MRVYVAGPLTKGDQLLNIRSAVEAGDRIQDAGHTVFIPHLSAQWHMLRPHGYEWWMRWCMDWLGVCDVLLRLPGESSGADREVERARELGIEVFLDFSDAFWRRVGEANVMCPSSSSPRSNPGT